MNKISLFSYFRIVVLTILITIMLLILVSMIPREYIKNNVLKSSEQLSALGEKSIINLRI